MNREEAEKILKELRVPKEIIAHCRTVEKKAREIVKILKDRGIDIDEELVTFAALLHDIGRIKTHGVRHGYLGGKIARELGLPEKVAKIIERHVGPGIPKEDAKKNGLPQKNFIPKRWEEKIVCHSDNLVAGKNFCSFEETLKSYEKKFGKDSKIVERLKKLHKEIYGKNGD